MKKFIFILLFLAISIVSGASSFDFPTLNQNTTGSAASLSISGQTGLLLFTGLTSTNRIKTVRDAADTVLELGGSYTPTGAWVWTSATVTWPTFNQNTTGTAAGLTAQYINWNNASGGTSIKNKPSGPFTYAYSALSRIQGGEILGNGMYSGDVTATRNSTGNYTVNFSGLSSNITIVATVNSSYTGFISVYSHGTGSCVIHTSDITGAPADMAFSILIYGTI